MSVYWHFLEKVQVNLRQLIFSVPENQFRIIGTHKAFVILEFNLMCVNTYGKERSTCIQLKQKDSYEIDIGHVYAYCVTCWSGVFVSETKAVSMCLIFET